MSSRRTLTLFGAAALMTAMTPLGTGGQLLAAPGRDALGVERDLELLAFRAFAEDLTETELEQRQSDQIFAIDGEVVPDRRATACAQRLAVERLVLTQITFDCVGHLHRRRFTFADRESADLRGRGDVALEQRWRDTQYVCDVVEAVARVVRGKQR